MSGIVRWHARGVNDTVLSAVDDQPDMEPTPTDDEVERCHALEREAQELAAEPADRAEIAAIRSLLGEPWADLPGVT